MIDNKPKLHLLFYFLPPHDVMTFFIFIISGALSEEGCCIDAYSNWGGFHNSYRGEQLPRAVQIEWRPRKSQTLVGAVPPVPRSNRRCEASFKKLLRLIQLFML